MSVTNPITAAVTGAITGAITGLPVFGGGTPPGATLKFHALTPDPTTHEMLGVKTGVGVLDTAHVSDLYAPDFEGTQNKFGTDDPVWSGGRVVTNLSRSSEDLINGECYAETGATIDTATTFTANGPNSGIRFHAATNKVVADDLLVIRVRIRNLSSQTVDIYVGPHGWDAGTSVLSYAPNQERIISIFGAALVSNCNILVRLPNTESATGISIFASDFQVENVNGRVNTDMPSEYVPNNVHNGTDTSTKVFANVNGNTVASNVVTEGIGAPLAEAPYLQYYPAATTHIFYNRDMTMPQWAKAQNATATLNQVGIDGAPNSCTLCSDADDTTLGRISQTTGDISSLTGQPITVVFWIKKKDSVAVFPRIGAWLAKSAFGMYASIDLSNGDIVKGAAGDASVIYESKLVGDFWKFMIEADTTADADTPIVELWPAQAASLGGVDNVASTGDMVVDAIQIFQNKTIAEVRGLGPIFTTTAAVSTDVTVYRFDIANHNPNESVYYLEYELSDVTMVSSSYMFSTDSTSARILYSGGSPANYLRSFDGVNSVTLATLSVVDTAYKASCIYHVGDNKFNVNRDGVYGSEGVSSGMAGGTLLGVAAIAWNAGAYKIRNIRRYNTASYAEGKSIIDGLMA